ncbi:MAG: HYR domain-containing protein [Saprospiraceae bacterium]
MAADGSCAGTLNDYTGSALVSSGCGIVTLASRPLPVRELSLGTISVTLTATDESNNTNSCSFDVTLEDQTKPSITCPVTQTVNADAFCEGTVGTWSAVAYI